MKIVFMGTPDFAVPAFQRLANEHEIVCVYTKSPKVSGRGNSVHKTPVHQFADYLGIEVRTPDTLRNKEEQDRFQKLNADVAVVAAYGLILPNEILNACKFGCLNLHASLLPRWRGAAPIQRCIEAGDKQSGVTIMKIAEGLDTGDMLLQGSVDITEEMTGGELHDSLAIIGADLISKVLKNISEYVPIKQDDSKVCYAAKITKEECLIDFKCDADFLYNKIRAFSPYPSMYFEYKGERFKIIKSEVIQEAHDCGIIAECKNELLIGCGDKSLKILEIQRQGKRVMSIHELLRGFSFIKGSYI